MPPLPHLPRFGSIDPSLMTATVIVCYAAQHGSAAALTHAAAGCFTLMPAMTLALNMPINPAVFRWGEQHGDPARWWQLRRRWDLIHSGRMILDRGVRRGHRRGDMALMTEWAPDAGPQTPAPRRDPCPASLNPEGEPW